MGTNESPLDKSSSSVCVRVMLLRLWTLRVVGVGWGGFGIKNDLVWGI